MQARSFSSAGLSSPAEASAGQAALRMPMTTDHVGFRDQETRFGILPPLALSVRRLFRRECGVFAVALMPVADALAAILEGVEPLGEEMVALEEAHHRTLARDV